jgi:phosphatidylglycerol---prolipoprotein diacylglyceryl transferase
MHVVQFRRMISFGGWIGNRTMSYPYLTDALNALLGTHWHLPIPTFGVIVALAVTTATYVATRVVRSYENLGRLPAQSHSTVWDMAIVSTLAGIVGARVFDIFDNADRFLADPLSMILTRTGFSIYGGLCFGIIAGVIFIKRRSIPVIPMLDATAPAIMLDPSISPSAILAPYFHARVNNSSKAATIS